MDAKGTERRPSWGSSPQTGNKLQHPPGKSKAARAESTRFTAGAVARSGVTSDLRLIFVD
jgi:hypothetical protein